MLRNDKLSAFWENNCHEKYNLYQLQKIKLTWPFTKKPIIEHLNTTAIGYN